VSDGPWPNSPNNPRPRVDLTFSKLEFLLKSWFVNLELSFLIL
jgi:hypothetical protein